MNLFYRHYSESILAQPKRPQCLLYLLLEIFWASMVIAAATFNAAFAIRLGSSNASVGLLTSLPALLAVMISIPAGRFLKSRTNGKSWVLGAQSAFTGQATCWWHCCPGFQCPLRGTGSQ
jgi:hypothetical protein